MKGLSDQERHALALFKERLLAQLPTKVEEVKLFGSKARGEASKVSDVDVWVLLNDDNWRLRGPVHRIASSVMRETDIDLALHIFTTHNVEWMKKTGSPLLMNVNEEGITL